MSGGVWERTAGYISNGNWNLNGYGSSFTKDKVSTKYATVYPRDASQDDSSKSYDTSTTEKFNQVYTTLSTANYKTNKYIDMTDETRIMFEEYGIKPHLIETGQNLFKVTYPRDVAVLESIYQTLKGEIK